MLIILLINASISSWEMHLGLMTTMTVRSSNPMIMEAEEVARGKSSWSGWKKTLPSLSIIYKIFFLSSLEKFIIEILIKILQQWHLQGRKDGK